MLLIPSLASSFFLSSLSLFNSHPSAPPQPPGQRSERSRAVPAPRGRRAEQLESPNDTARNIPRGAGRAPAGSIYCSRRPGIFLSPQGSFSRLGKRLCLFEKIPILETLLLKPEGSGKAHPQSAGRPQPIPIAQTHPRETRASLPPTLPTPIKLHCCPGHKATPTADVTPMADATLMAGATLTASLAGARGSGTPFPVPSSLPQQ
ncbi:uncharacterized protein LOC129197317 [Grus americana]|uniref:uncharacterized protein LOC129197317 n=1 Tax=Grus americana TaxID=9117 RepID=UPI002407C524|nr:uncharacterized protein LOC129197317 [Grus americana]